MVLLLLLLCALGSAWIDVPLIDGADRSSVFHKSMRDNDDYDRRFMQIVDTVSSDSPSSSRKMTNYTVSYGLRISTSDASKPNYFGYYEYVTNELADLLECTQETGNITHTHTVDIPFDRWRFELRPRLEYSRDQRDALLRGLEFTTLYQHEFIAWKAPHVERKSCTYKRTPEMMRFNFNMSTGNIRSGWVIESTSIGEFVPCINSDWDSVGCPAHETAYRASPNDTIYSFIDSTNGAMFNVEPTKDDNGKRIWKRSKEAEFTDRITRVIIKKEELNEFTVFRETETGVLVDTLAETIFLAYTLNNVTYKERIQLHGNHYHVNCGQKQGDSTLSNTATNAGVTISYLSLSKGTVISHHTCSWRRDTANVILGVREIEVKTVQSDGPFIPRHDRIVTTGNQESLNIIREKAATALETEEAENGDDVIRDDHNGENQ